MLRPFRTPVQGSCSQTVWVDAEVGLTCSPSRVRQSAAFAESHLPPSLPLGLPQGGCGVQAGEAAGKAGVSEHRPVPGGLQGLSLSPGIQEAEGGGAECHVHPAGAWDLEERPP